MVMSLRRLLLLLVVIAGARVAVVDGVDFSAALSLGFIEPRYVALAGNAAALDLGGQYVIPNDTFDSGSAMFRVGLGIGL